MFSLPVLEHQLVMYVTADDKGQFQEAFDLSKTPVVTREQADAEDRTKKLTEATPTIKAPTAGPKPTPKGAAEAAESAAEESQKYAEQLQKIPELAAYGGVLKSSSVVELTESETEYVVTAVKHIFKNNIVLQFDIKNTLPDTILCDVSVIPTPVDEDEETPPLEEEFTIPAPKLVTDEPGTVYVSLKRTADAPQFVSTSFSNILKFTSKEIDPTTNEPEEGGYEDEYQVEDLDLNGSDYVMPAYAASFEEIWSGLEEGDDASETLQLSNMKSIAGAYSHTILLHYL